MRCQYTGTIPLLLFHDGRVWEIAPGAITDTFAVVPSLPPGQWRRLRDPDPPKPRKEVP